MGTQGTAGKDTGRQEGFGSCLSSWMSLLEVYRSDRHANRTGRDRSGIALLTEIWNSVRGTLGPPGQPGSPHLGLLLLPIPTPAPRPPPREQRPWQGAMVAPGVEPVTAGGGLLVAV